MQIPIYFNAAPSRARESGITRIPDGKWVVEGDCVDTQVSAVIGNDPLTILTEMDKRRVLPLTIDGPTFIVCFIDVRGNEKNINVLAKRVKNGND